MPERVHVESPAGTLARSAWQNAETHRDFLAHDSRAGFPLQIQRASPNSAAAAGEKNCAGPSEEGDTDLHLHMSQLRLRLPVVSVRI